MATIRVFVTGGTFDKQYNELTGSLAFTKTHLPEMLRLGRSRVDVSIRTLMMIDSLDMSDANRSLFVGFPTPLAARTACSICAARSRSCRRWRPASTSR